MEQGNAVYNLCKKESAKTYEVTWRTERVRLNKQIPVTSLVFRNFYLDYYSNRFELGFRLELDLGLELSFLGIVTKSLRARSVLEAFSTKITRK